jgi:hypothetical protein
MGYFTVTNWGFSISFHWTLWSHFCFIFGWSQVQISTQRLTVLSEAFTVFFSPSRQMPGWHHKLRPCLLPSTFFLIHYLLII